MRWKNKLFTALNVINSKALPYASKVIPRHYHYQSDLKLSPGIFVIRIIPFSCHTCTYIIYLYWDNKTKEAVHHPRNGIVNYVIADKNVVTKIMNKSTGLQRIELNGFAKRHWQTCYYPFAYGWSLGLC